MEGGPAPSALISLLGLGMTVLAGIATVSVSVFAPVHVRELNLPSRPIACSK
jgi:hypothetical protein